MRLVLVLAATSVLAGCAAPATGPQFSPVSASAPGDAVVYVYRESRFALGVRPAYFYVNGVNVFDLSAGGYSWLSLSPGTYRIRQSWPADLMAKPLESDLVVHSGEVRYLAFDTGGCTAGYREICLSWQLREERPEIARAALSSKHFQENFGMDKLKALARP